MMTAYKNNLMELNLLITSDDFFYICLKEFIIVT